MLAFFPNGAGKIAIFLNGKQAKLAKIRMQGTKNGDPCKYNPSGRDFFFLFCIKKGTQAHHNAGYFIKRERK